jgi:hypothetical protein
MSVADTLAAQEGAPPSVAALTIADGAEKPVGATEQHLDP